MARITNAFRRFAGIDGVIGAVDGTFVPIKAPKENSEVFITRKKNYAMTLQCIAESSLKFTDAFIAYPGPVSDCRVFRNSYIYEMVNENPHNFFNGNFILGDKAYPLLEWCLTPYLERRRLTPVQTNFNLAHAKTRQVIERSFSLLFGRFRRLKYLDMNRTDLIPETVIACCTLHNICLDHNDLLMEEYIREGCEFLGNDDENNVQNNILMEPEVAINRRDNIALTLFNR